uniref:Uncharacterized protein n=1 Tax=Meloidogyne incognita TaxID=6306 RepID=A0A914KTA4_MELIC
MKENYLKPSFGPIPSILNAFLGFITIIRSCFFNFIKARSNDMTNNFYCFTCRNNGFTSFNNNMRSVNNGSGHSTSYSTNYTPNKCACAPCDCISNTGTNSSPSNCCADNYGSKTFGMILRAVIEIIVASRLA